MGYVPILTFLWDMEKEIGFELDSKFCLTHFALFQVESSFFGYNWRKITEKRRIHSKMSPLCANKKRDCTSVFVFVFAGFRPGRNLTEISV